MTAALRQAPIGYWIIAVIGAVLVVIVIVAAVAAARRRHRRATTPGSATRSADELLREAGRYQGPITEALLAQQRVSGQIDAATYQAGMKDLAWQGAGDRSRRHGVT